MWRLGEDVGLQLPQPGTGVHAEFRHQGLACPAQLGQGRRPVGQIGRGRWPATARRLRVADGCARGLAGRRRLGSTSQDQRCLGPTLHGQHPQLVQPGRPPHEPSPPRRTRRTRAPARGRATRPAGQRRRTSSSRQQPSGLADHRLEPPGVHRVRCARAARSRAARSPAAGPAAGATGRAPGHGADRTRRCGSPPPRRRAARPPTGRRRAGRPARPCPERSAGAPAPPAGEDPSAKRGRGQTRPPPVPARRTQPLAPSRAWSWPPMYALPPGTQFATDSPLITARHARCSTRNRMYRINSPLSQQRGPPWNR